jgi:hypothetical protein
MTKLTKPRNTGWGDNLIDVRKDKGEIAKSAEDKILAEYLIQLRKIFETDNQVKSIIIDSKPAIAAKSRLLKLLTHECKPDSKDLFERAMDIVLNELDNFRDKPASLYLIDRNTGMPIMPMTDELIYTPPDYIGEDGKLHKSKPILHPGIAASLTLAVYGKNKLQRHLKKITGPLSEQAYKHLSEPERIIEMVKERLNYIGVEISDNPNECDQVIEFGREQVEGIMQSPNIRFHRAHMFAAILAHKILKLGGKAAKYTIGSIESKQNTKQKWYTVKIGVLELAVIDEIMNN